MAAERRGEGIVTALIYRRVSKEDMAREGMSLPAQLAETRRYCAERGWLIGAEFEDVLSGLRDDRPQYRALLAEVRRLRTNNQAVVVVVAALDRLGRRFLERVRAREELKALGVATHSVREGGEVSDLVANVLASVAEEEVRRLKERVTAVRRHAISNGYRPVGRSAWGYRWRQATPEERQSGAPQKVLEIDADRAPYVLELGQRVADGQSVRAAARWVQSLPAEVRDHREWTLTGVLKLLRAPVYVARPDDGDADVLARPVGRWPAIYSDDLWLRIQERIAGHARLAHQASRGDTCSPACCAARSVAPGWLAPAGGSRRRGATTTATPASRPTVGPVAVWAPASGLPLCIGSTRRCSPRWLISWRW